MKAQHSQERQAEDNLTGFGKWAQFLGRRTTSWSNLVNVCFGCGVFLTGWRMVVGVVFVVGMCRCRF